MNKKIKIDILLLFIFTAINASICFGIKETSGANFMIVLMSVLSIAMVVILYRDYKAYVTYGDESNEGEGYRYLITSLSLLNEQDGTVKKWDIFDRISLVIGKDVGENHVDINLNQVAYSAMIDIEHAVMNYTNECWYIEDLGSKNGLAIQKKDCKSLYRLAANEPCRIELGDIIVIGRTRLQLK